MSDGRISGAEARRREALADASCEVVCYRHAADLPLLLKDISMDGEGLYVEVGPCSVCAATVEALEQERDEARDCGQDGGCALSPGCQRHWMERNTELWRERDEALERLANVRAALRAGEPKP